MFSLILTIITSQPLLTKNPLIITLVPSSSYPINDNLMSKFDLSLNIWF